MSKRPVLTELREHMNILMAAALLITLPLAAQGADGPGASDQTAEPAQPGEGVARMAIVGEPLIVIPALGSTTLTVQTTPNQKVRFVSMDGGELASGQGSIAVAADAQGRASATYRAVAGIIGTVRVIATSPGASGRAEYRIEVGAPAGNQP